VLLSAAVLAAGCSGTSAAARGVLQLHQQQWRRMILLLFSKWRPHVGRARGG